MSKTRDFRSSVDERQKVPRWLPITLLTVATVALTVPAALLWRQRQSLVQHIDTIPRRNNSAYAPAPLVRRRPLTVPGFTQSSVSRPSVVSQTGSHTPAPPPRRRTSVRSNALTAESVATRKPAISSTVQGRGTNISEYLFDGPLLSLGAFGLATGAVAVGAVLGIWGVQKAMGVNNAEEFGARVRQMLLTHFPDISRRIYRSSSDENATNPSSIFQYSQRSDPHQKEENESWTWEAAENRLRDAFDRGGVGEWADRAIQELEAEERVERRRRGL